MLCLEVFKMVLLGMHRSRSHWQGFNTVNRWRFRRPDNFRRPPPPFSTVRSYPGSHHATWINRKNYHSARSLFKEPVKEAAGQEFPSCPYSLNPKCWVAALFSHYRGTNHGLSAAFLCWIFAQWVLTSIIWIIWKGTSWIIAALQQRCGNRLSFSDFMMLLKVFLSIIRTVTCSRLVESACPTVTFGHMICVIRWGCTKMVWISFSALSNYPCCKDHVEEEGIIFLALLKSHDGLQRSPFTSLIASTSPWIFNVLEFCVACLHCTAHDQTYIKSASISWCEWSL